MDNVPFDVVDEYEVQDLTEVKADRNLFPATKDLKVRVNKVTTQSNDDKDILSLNVELRAVDGIQGADGVMTRIEAPIFTGFMDLVYGADLDVKGRADNKWWKNNQHLVEFKNFLTATGHPLSGIKVNDEFLSNLIGMEVLVSVIHEAETVNDPSGKLKANGKPEKVKTGEFQQKLKNWKKVV